MAGDDDKPGMALAMALPVLLCMLGLGGCAWYTKIRQQIAERRRQQLEQESGAVRPMGVLTGIGPVGERGEAGGAGGMGSGIDRHMAQARRLEAQARLPAVTPSPPAQHYFVPRAVQFPGKGEDQVIELAEISVEEDIELQKKHGREGYFKMKLSWLDRELAKLHPPGARAVRLEVDRSNLFHDSFRAFSRLSGDKLRQPLQVKFKKEEGRDDGGLTRHWFMLISREVVNPEYAMFVSLGKDHTYHINSASMHQPHYLEYFRFIGRVWGKAAFDGFLVESHLTSSVYKYLLGIQVCDEDLHHVDGAYHNSLQWMLNNDIDAAKLDMTFSIDEDVLGSITTVELKEGGSNIAVTNENKDEYVRLAAMRRLVTGIQPQLDAMRKGFREAFPEALLEKFSESELELVLCGLPCIDVQDWRRYSEYRAGFTEDDDTIRWFWEIVNDWDQGMRARLLQFVTGTSKVPTGGFAELYGATGPKRFQIIRVFDTTRLPQANTCFNELLLPPYHSKETLADMLVMSILDGGDHFGLR